MIYSLAFVVVFIRIGLAVLQQRNVEEGRVKLIPAQSMVMQFFDCATYGLGGAAFMSQDWWQVAAMGVGAGTGSLTAMWVDRTWLRKLPAPVAAKPALRLVNRASRPPS